MIRLPGGDGRLEPRRDARYLDVAVERVIHPKPLLLGGDDPALDGNRAVNVQDDIPDGRIRHRLRLLRRTPSSAAAAATMSYNLPETNTAAAVGCSDRFGATTPTTWT